MQVSLNVSHWSTPAQLADDVTLSSDFTINDVTHNAIASSHDAYEPWQAVLISNVCALIVAGTILGNALVCTAVAITRKLRVQPSNLLVVSLALADLLVAAVDMPFATAYEVTGHWSLGQAMCDVWTSLDVFLCTASILNLCVISVDRYLVITRPFRYAMKRTPLRMALMIVAVWVLSAVISIPPLLMGKDTALPVSDGVLGESIETFPLLVESLIDANETPHNLLAGRLYDNESIPVLFAVHPTKVLVIENHKILADVHLVSPITQEPKPEQCIVNQSIGYQVYATVFAFYIPLSVMVVIYGRIYLVSSRLARAELRSKLPPGGTGSCPAVGGGSLTPPEAPLARSTFSLEGRQMSLTPTISSITPLRRGESSPTQLDGSAGNGARGVAEERGQVGAPLRRSRGQSLGELIPRKIRSSCTWVSRVGGGLGGHSGQERKATKTLGVIMGAFVVCWLPFFILALIKPFCLDPATCIPAALSSTFLWLGYANSFLNPIIYARFNRDFRIPFKYILQGKCANINSRLRYDEFTIQFGPLVDRRESTLTAAGTAAGLANIV